MRGWGIHRPAVGARVADDFLAPPADPDLVTGRVQLHALMDQLDRRAVKAGAIPQMAVSWHADGAARREIKRLGRQRPQRAALLGQPLADDELTGRVPAPMSHPIAPVAIDLVQLGQRENPPHRPEPGLHIADRALD